MRALGLVSDLLLHVDPLINVYNREGRDGAIDALSSDRTTVFQSKHHKYGTSAIAFADARRELAKIIEYRDPTHRWHDVWSEVTTWRLVSNVPFGTADDERWNLEIAPLFAKEGLAAQHVLLPQLEAMLTDHPAVSDAFFGQRPRLFISLAEHRETLVAREVLQRAYDLPLEGRATELATISSFVRGADHQVLLVHGPGGLGKSRLILDAAYAEIAAGTVSTVYCGTQNLATSDNWYVGIVPEARALVLLDEPTDARFVERFLSELRTRTKQWKVVIAVRTPRDPVIRALTDPRERLLAPPCELAPMNDQTAERYASQLLAPLSLEDDQRKRASRWLVEVCGRVPIWMTVGVALLERGADLRDLPKDEFEIAQRYLRDILEHTPLQDADSRQVLQVLRWTALAQPLNRHSEAEVAALAAAARIDEVALERVIADLVRRRVLTPFGVRGRMIELRPDVLRDHLLIEWLTTEGSGGRRPSAEARQLAASLVETTTTSVTTSMIETLERLEYLTSPRVLFLDPIADAAVSRAENATGTTEQKAAFEFASLIARARPASLARAAQAIRTREVPETALSTIFGDFKRSRADVLEELPWQLFVAAHAASTAEERRMVLGELLALVDGAGSGKRFAINTGRAAVDLLPRLIHERRGYRTSFHPEVRVSALQMLDELARGIEPLPSAPLVLRALLDISRHESFSDEDDENLVHIETVRILPRGELGRIATAIREGLWRIVSELGPWNEARRLCWKLLDHFHVQLNQNKSDVVWRDLMISDLVNARRVAERVAASLEDVQAARRLWRWHLKHERDIDTKALAEGCERTYLAIPLVASQATIFANDAAGDHLFDTARNFATPSSVAALDDFMTEAMRFASTHADDWRVNRVLSFATWLGELQASSHAVFVEYVETHLRAGSTSPHVNVARAMASGYLQAIRANDDDTMLVAALDRLVACVRDGGDLARLLAALYADPGPVSARRFGSADFEMLLQHWDAFVGLPQRTVFTILGRFLAVRNDSLDRAMAHLPSGERDAGEAIACIWHGFFETLPYPLTGVPPIASRLIDVSAMLPDTRGPFGNLEWEVGEILKHLPRASLGWLVQLIRARLLAFGEENRRPGRDRLWIHILPHEESFILDHVAAIPDTSPTEDARSAVAALLAMEDEDETIAHDLPEFFVAIDPHGRLVPETVAAILADSSQTATAEEMSRMARVAGWYAVGSSPWRTIASVACARALELNEDVRPRVYSQLRSHRMESWSGTPGEVHPRWQDAVDEATRALSDETDSALRAFWEYRVEVERARLEFERGRLEERER